MHIIPVDGDELHESPATATMQATAMALMLVDTSGVPPARRPTLTGAGMLPEEPSHTIKHASAALHRMNTVSSHNMVLFSSRSFLEKAKSDQQSRADRRDVELDELGPIGGGTKLIPVLGKRRRSSPVSVLALAMLCQAERRISVLLPPPPPPPPQQQQEEERPLQQQISLHKPQVDLPKCRSGESPYCTTTGSPNCRLSKMEGNLQGGNEQHESICTKDDFCTSPKRAGSGRQMIEVETLRCPPPPSKAAFKRPKRLSSLLCKKKFFVPSNLAELPPVLQSLFTN